MTWIPNPDDPLGGNPVCAGSGSTCTECVNPADGGGYWDCVYSQDGQEWDCRQYA